MYVPKGSKLICNKHTVITGWIISKLLQMESPDVVVNDI